jgi:hypothetical protein
MRRYSVICGMICIAGIAPDLSAQTPLGTDFVYQGRLQASGLPSVSNADFQFSLFDAVIGGNQVGSTLAKNNVALVNGIFSLSLDFGGNAFKGDARWIEIAVRSPAGTGGFTTLTPRQVIAPTPQAQFAVQTRGIRIDAPNGATPNTALGLESNGEFAEIIRISPDGNVGVGSINPQAKLQVRGIDPVLAIQSTGTTATQTGRLGFWDNGLNENAWAGFGTFGSPDFSLVNKRAGGELKFFAQNTERVTIKADGEVHINGTLTHIPETRSFTLHGAEFNVKPDPQANFSVDASGIHDHSGENTSILFWASPHLPDGAMVLAMEIIGFDGVTLPGFDMQCILLRKSFSGGDSELMAEVNSDLTGSPWRTEDITSPTINNNFNAYVVRAELLGGPTAETEHRLTAVRLIYSVTQPLP